MPSEVELRPRSALRLGQQMAIDRLKAQPHNMLALGMAIGKTGAVLTAIRDLLDTFQVNHVLVIAPLLVAEEVWPDEIETWEHTQVLNYEVLTGPPERRENRAKRLPELSIINFENVTWLVDFWGDDFPYDWVIVDESSKMKNPAKKTKPTKKAVEKIVNETLAKLPKDMHPDDVKVALDRAAKKAPRYPTRFGALCSRIRYTERFTTMTGTIAPNGLLDLWSQYYLLDRGERLGTSYSAYRGRWFDGDYMGFKYTPKIGAFDQIMDRIRDITISMRTEDYADLPEVLHNHIKVKLPPKVMQQYRKFEKTLLWQYGNEDIEAVNNGVLTGKTLQLANGSIYDEEGEAHEIHDLKMEALDRVIEEANGAPVLVAYSYQFDLEKLRKKYPKAEVVGEAKNLQKRWNRGEIPILLAHPACMHPDTLVLTENRGWVRLIDVRASERVFDGVEFVSHKGCQLSGVRQVIDKFGLVMTPDHPILVQGKWVEAQDVPDTEESRQKARYPYSGDVDGAREMSCVRFRPRTYQAERGQGQRRAQTDVRRVSGPEDTWYDRREALSHLAGIAGTLRRSCGAELRALRRSWDFLRSSLGGFFRVLVGHASGVRRPFDYRTTQCERGLHEGQLLLDTGGRSASEQTHDQSGDLSGSADAPCGVLSKRQSLPRGDNSVLRTGGEGGWRCGDGTLSAIEVPVRKKIPVYDLVDCGPRRRFMVKNSQGETFVVHNSAGHGLNLQYGGCILVWYGLPWSLEYYQQLNERLRRPGQPETVIIHHLIAEGTVDERVIRVLPEKQATQDAVIEATLYVPDAAA